MVKGSRVWHSFNYSTIFLIYMTDFQWDNYLGSSSSATQVWKYFSLVEGKLL